MTDRNDWDKLFDQLTQGSENDKSKIMVLLNGLAAMVLTTAIVAVAIMIINKGASSAWPKIAEVFPPIGYLNAVVVAVGIVILKAILSIFDIATKAESSD